jgi:transcriptional regulator of acetoin/glycerol metabolism
MLGAVAQSKTNTKSQTGDERKKSKLVQIGEEAMRRALLEALVTAEWNLTHTAAALEMSSASHVLRSIRQLGLMEKYKAEKKRRIAELD